MRRCLPCLFAFLLLAGPAMASGGGGHGGGHGGGAKPKSAAGNSIEMPFLIAPMSQDGKLLGYAYISSKMVCTSPAACVEAREKLAFIQDANVREVNARPVAKHDDPRAVDQDALNTRLTAIARRIVGPNKVVNMIFTAVQFAPLHPSESTAGMMASSGEAGAPGQQAQAGEHAAQASGSAHPPEATSAATSKPRASGAH